MLHIKPEIKFGKLLESEIKMYIKHNKVVSAQGIYTNILPISSIEIAINYIYNFMRSWENLKKGES
jgi:hypothetical protein